VILELLCHLTPPHCERTRLTTERGFRFERTRDGITVSYDRWEGNVVLVPWSNVAGLWVEPSQEQPLNERPSNTGARRRSKS